MKVSSEESLLRKTYIPLKSSVFAATFPGSQQKWYLPLLLIIPSALKLTSNTPTSEVCELLCLEADG